MNFLPSKTYSRGSSMLPLIPNGATVHINFSVTSYHIGDIVIFYQNKGLYMHRIIYKISPKAFIIKGDNNSFIDGHIHIKKIFGKVVAIEHDGHTKDLDSTQNKIYKYCYTTRSLINYVYVNHQIILLHAYKSILGRISFIRGTESSRNKSII